MEKIIKNQIINIYGLPGSGKTFFAVFIAQFYNRRLSNVMILDKWGKKSCTPIYSIDDLFAFGFSDEKGIVLIDEVGVNNNARRSSSDSNLEFGKLGMLSRKLNVDIICIAQLERMNDVYFRELAMYSFELSSRFCKAPPGRTGQYIIFDVVVKNRFGTILKKFEIDLIKASEEMGFSYSTLDKSIIDKKKGTKIETFAPL